MLPDAIKLFDFPYSPYADFEVNSSWWLWNFCYRLGQRGIKMFNCIAYISLKHFWIPHWVPYNWPTTYTDWSYTLMYCNATTSVLCDEVLFAGCCYLSFLFFSYSFVCWSHQMVHTQQLWAKQMYGFQQDTGQRELQIWLQCVFSGMCQCKYSFDILIQKCTIKCQIFLILLGSGSGLNKQVY